MFSQLPNLTYSGLSAVHVAALVALLGIEAGASLLALPVVFARSASRSESAAVASAIHSRRRVVDRIGLVCLWPAAIGKVGLFGPLLWFHYWWLGCLGAMTICIVAEHVVARPLERLTADLDLDRDPPGADAPGVDPAGTDAAGHRRLARLHAIALTLGFGRLTFGALSLFPVH